MNKLQSEKVSNECFSLHSSYNAISLNNQIGDCSTYIYTICSLVKLLLMHFPFNFSISCCSLLHIRICVIYFSFSGSCALSSNGIFFVLLITSSSLYKSLSDISPLPLGSGLGCEASGFQPSMQIIWKVAGIKYFPPSFFPYSCLQMTAAATAVSRLKCNFLSMKQIVMCKLPSDLQIHDL